MNNADENGSHFEIFLSRLCGGEHDSLLRVPATLFLSRLCGGELTFFEVTALISFLSRLCGGEH